MEYIDPKNPYFRWLYRHVYDERNSSVSYMLLLQYLHSKKFYWVLPLDSSRYEDGLAMRRSYFAKYPEQKMLVGDCTILEMMVALAFRLEDHIMQDSDIGNRTGQWFWQMIINMGLGHMTDDRFNEAYCDDVIDIFLSRTYQHSGKGGLFPTKDPTINMPEIDIWYQAQWYLQDVIHSEQKEG